MSFKEWLRLQEIGTGTNAIAVFSRPIGIGMVTRPPLDGDEHDEHPKKKRKHKKKKDDLDH